MSVVPFIAEQGGRAFEPHYLVSLSFLPFYCRFRSFPAHLFLLEHIEGTAEVQLEDKAVVCATPPLSLCVISAILPRIWPAPHVILAPFSVTMVMMQS